MKAKQAWGELWRKYKIWTETFERTKINKRLAQRGKDVVKRERSEKYPFQEHQGKEKVLFLLTTREKWLLRVISCLSSSCCPLPVWTSVPLQSSWIFLREPMWDPEQFCLWNKVNNLPGKNAISSTRLTKWEWEHFHLWIKITDNSPSQIIWRGLGIHSIQLQGSAWSLSIYSMRNVRMGINRVLCALVTK